LALDDLQAAKEIVANTIQITGFLTLSNIGGLPPPSALLKAKQLGSGRCS
jgi:hypothetical protein